MQIDLHNVDRVWMNQCAKMFKPKVISLEVRHPRCFAGGWIDSTSRPIARCASHSWTLSMINRRRCQSVDCTCPIVYKISRQRIIAAHGSGGGTMAKIF